ncbi:unnamed protein product [Amoebophrya sp. A25]|nr:unnamed protein product [Amoebophrya sp. A25]|eukprot:GSA25T00007009001.1
MRLDGEDRDVDKIAGKLEDGHLGRVASFFGDFIKHHQYFSTDSAYKIYLINCPFVFRAVWRGFSIFIPQATREKIKLVGADYAAKLKTEGVVLILNAQTKDKATDFGKLTTPSTTGTGFSFTSRRNRCGTS